MFIAYIVVLGKSYVKRCERYGCHVSMVCK